MQTGQKIASLREKAGLTQTQLAELLFVSRELVSKWETGKSRPGNKTLSRIAVILGVEKSEITDVGEGLALELSACIPAEVTLTADELAALINGFLGGLTALERGVFIAKYYHGLTSAETSAELGIREGSVRKKLMLLRKQFTDYVREKCNG